MRYCISTLSSEHRENANERRACGLGCNGLGNFTSSLLVDGGKIMGTGTWWRCKCGNQNPPLVFICTEARCRRPRPDIPVPEPRPKPKPEPMPTPHPNMPKPPTPRPQEPDQPKKNPNPTLVKFGVWFGILSSVLGIVAWFVPSLKPWVMAIVPIIKAILSILGV